MGIYIICVQKELVTMSFKEYLFDKFSRIGIFIVGALLLPIGGIIASIGMTTTKK
jgi:hypothetical protein